VLRKAEIDASDYITTKNMARIVKKTTFVKRIEDFQLSDVDKTLAM